MHGGSPVVSGDGAWARLIVTHRRKQRLSRPRCSKTNRSVATGGVQLREPGEAAASNRRLLIGPVVYEAKPILESGQEGQAVDFRSDKADSSWE
jgi:hypothetical protein